MNNEPKIEVLSLSGDATGGMPELLSTRLQEVTSAIGNTIIQIQNEIHLNDSVNDTRMKLDGIEVKFGIAVEAEAGILLVGKTKGAANFEIAISFSR